MSPQAETLTVFLHELRRAARSPKTLVLLLLYALAALLSGLVFVAATRSIQQGLTAAGAPPAHLLAEMKMGGLAIFFGKDEALLRYLAQIPLIVVFFFKFALFFLPLLIALVGFDQVSSELQTRSLRFSALRARRGALLAGKVLAQATLVLALTMAVELGLFVYAAATTERFAVLWGLEAMGRFWLLSAVYSATYLGLTALCSALFRAPTLSLLSALCALFGFWLLSVLPYVSPALAPLSYLTPSRYDDQLLSPDPVQALGAVGAYAGFAAVFFALAWLALRERDL